MLPRPPPPALGYPWADACSMAESEGTRVALGLGPSDYYVADARPADTIGVGLEARRHRKALRAALRRQRRAAEAAHAAKGHVDEADPAMQG